MNDAGNVPRAPSEGEGKGAEIDRRLLEFLVCPITRGRLDYDRARQELVSRGGNRAYSIQNGIPIMLVDEARPLDE